MSEAEKKLLSKVIEITERLSKKRWIEQFHGTNVFEREIIFTSQLHQELLELYY